MRTPAYLLVSLSLLPLAACGEPDDSMDTDPTTTATDTTSATTTTETTTDTSTGDGDGDTTTGDGDGDGDGTETTGAGWGWDTDGTPEGMWCYDTPGPHPQYAFGLAAGSHTVQTTSDCAGWFIPGPIYTLVVDEVTGSLSIDSEFTQLTHVWDDTADHSCEYTGGGVDLTTSDDPMNGIEIAVDATGTAVRVWVWADSTAACTMIPA